ncbi:discoidin domain-containing protein [bacterium]|nr:discoidin domain-containing protein [bacterium]
MRAFPPRRLLLLCLGACATLAHAAGVPVGDAMKPLIEKEWLGAARQPAASAPKASNISTQDDAAGGCDGVKTGAWGFHVASKQKDPWWQVDLGTDTRLDRIIVFNRTDGGCAPRTKNLDILVSREAEPKAFERIHQQNGVVFLGVKQGKPLVVDLSDRNIAARIVRLAIPGNCSFALDEVEVYAAAAPKTNIALGKPADQISTSQHSTPRAVQAVAKTAADDDAQFPAARTQEVIARARKLAARLPDPDRLKPHLAKLDAIEKQLAVGSTRELHLAACWAARSVAFANPLLSADRLLFIKRHHPKGPYHMCDQFYGCNAVAGGGLFALENPFSGNPTLVNLLENSVVQAGRLKGQKLDTGAFLSPEMSFDGGEILFAYSEAKAKKTYQWFPECAWHIFKCNADGTNLVQLTDGATDDFDPCFLPNGRIAFTSTRRGGYLRCGRHCPVYALFSMADDGSDIIPLSYHETHEWQPSVDNHGMLVYTRWDYVDRDTNIAHHAWISYPDGRDPRSYHGNYPVKRESRPWMEMDIRAVPGSTKYVATTGAHHGNALGALVLIDHGTPDDGAMSQLESITPDCAFPEATRGKGGVRAYSQYGTAWPLSEDDYLCMYDSKAKNHALYWIDRAGNRELLYRDPAIPCFSPMPLRSRRRPPVIPSGTTQTADDIARAGGVRPSTVAVLNVYESDFEWPQGTQVRALRIVQVLAKATPPPNKPRIGAANQTNARRVLGTVPVESDGSAYFQCPPGKAIYFQAIDQRGTAVMSMRSATYVHPGERLTCIGCHEPKRHTAAQDRPTPLALRREPSPITPDVDGSNPFNYVRLVQPALDRHCVSCHTEKKALDLTGALGGPNGWSRSYTNLAGKYGFYFNVGNGSINQGVHGGARTIPGKFGARAAPLAPYLTAKHHGVKLPPQDLHRIQLWLDCNSEFYGCYENIAEQAKGLPVIPSLE